MLGDQFIKIVQENRRSSLIMSGLTVILTAGLTFTFVIPGLKGFDWFFLIATLSIYLLIATVFTELFKDKILLVLSSSLVLSTAGMGWRLWLEWGEFSLVDHMHPAVLIGYPIIITLVISFSYSIFSKVNLKKATI